ncbi:hypothetical protein [Brevibacillus brevis]|uniref:Uncharacterized protein n=1 Tax=Brevibacillus brevis TaxID=1393 RepID=A0A517I4E4_BREBE|nr:hypothetical protein [Brevibacillus brevis]QDS33767.1 hypothetical protein FPS98_07045 [Brevibacillus brevis]
MTLLYEHHYESVATPLPPVDPDALAEMYVVIYDSVRKDYAINVSKLVRVDGVWWVPVEKLLRVERV